MRLNYFIENIYKFFSVLLSSIFVLDWMLCARNKFQCCVGRKRSREYQGRESYLIEQLFMVKCRPQ